MALEYKVRGQTVALELDLKRPGFSGGSFI